MKVCILGTGAYGLALSSVIYNNHHEVTMWSKFSTELTELESKRMSDKLPNYHIPVDYIFTNNIERALSGKDLIVIAVPAAFVDDVSSMMAPYLQDDQFVCIASKGIENDTCLFVADVFQKHISTSHFSIISGPSFAVDIVEKVPVGLSLGTQDMRCAEVVKQAFLNDYFKLRVTDDVKGIEICGSIKNVIALASGMIDGMGMPESTKAMFITESLHDVKELIFKLGGDKKTILSFAGFGDLLLTCTSPKSRNFTLGYMVGSGKSKEEIDYYISHTTIEGLYTLKSIYQLTKGIHVDMPIIDLIYDIIHHDKSCEELKLFLIHKD